MSWLLFPVYKLSRENTQGENMWQRFWKGERSWCDSKQNVFLCRSSGSRGSLKKVLWEISQNSQENICAGIFFLIKLNSFTILNLQFIKKETLAQVFCCGIAKFVRTPFLQNTIGRQLLITGVSIVVKGGLGNETVNYDTKTKA